MDRVYVEKLSIQELIMHLTIGLMGNIGPLDLVRLPDALV